MSAVRTRRTASVVCRAAFFLAVSGSLSPGECGERPEPDDLSLGWLAFWGALSGAGMAVAYIAPPGDGWLVADETALPAGIVIGLGTALLVKAAAPDTDRLGGRRPQLRVAAGRGGTHDAGYSIAYRQPFGASWELEASLLVSSDTRETT